MYRLEIQNGSLSPQKVVAKMAIRQILDSSGSLYMLNQHGGRSLRSGVLLEPTSPG